MSQRVSRSSTRGTFRRVALALALAWIPLTHLACSANHLVFTTTTKVGLDLSGSQAQPGNLMFGYKRFEGAIVPVDVAAAMNNPGVDAMSVYALINLDNKWFEGLNILQIFATGEAAKHAASDPVAFAQLVEKFKAGKEDDKKKDDDKRKPDTDGDNSQQGSGQDDQQGGQ